MSERPPEELPLRACACSFCARHGARTTSDPHGRVVITVHDAAELARYRFGLATADFLVCRRCGVYVAAVLEAEGTAYATVNINALEARGRFTREVAAVSYEGEDAAGRIARRRAHWTPAVVRVLG